MEDFDYLPEILIYCRDNGVDMAMRRRIECILKETPNVNLTSVYSDILKLNKNKKIISEIVYDYLEKTKIDSFEKTTLDLLIEHNSSNEFIFNAIFLSEYYTYRGIYENIDFDNVRYIEQMENFCKLQLKDKTSVNINKSYFEIIDNIELIKDPSQFYQNQILY